MANVIIPRHTDLGKAAAEDDDEYFSDCFVDTGLIDRLLSANSSCSIIVGRTGGGKSAILKRIRENNQNVCEISPENLSLGYLADSWLLQFLTENQFDLSLFYQQLWRHVIVVELLRFYEGLDDSAKSQGFSDRIVGLFRENPGKKKAFEYLTKYGGEFWSDTDERVKNITDDFQRQVEEEYGLKYKPFEAKYKRGETIGRHETRELVSKAQQITHSIQMQELAKILDILNEDVFTNKMKKTVLVIDDLDRQWADDRIRMKLIEALIDVIPKFRKINNVKIVVAMRDVLLDTVLDQATTAGFQRDKFKDYHTRISWKDFELRQMIDRRVSHLFKRKYTSESVSLSDLFEENKTSQDYFSYICERTMLRPRDILSYFNLLFERCSGKSKITLKDIRSVEFDYSKDRRQALVDEWREHVPCVDDVLSFLGNRKLSANFRIGAVGSDLVDQFAIDLCIKYPDCDSAILKYAKAHFEDHSENSRVNFLLKLISLLYRIGALGLRTQENSSPQFSFISKPSISVDELSANTQCIVHPMLWQNLGRRADLKPLFTS
jgi:hypothetical protein